MRQYRIDTLHAILVGTYPYFAQNFLMALLAAVAAGIILSCFGNVRRWPKKLWAIIILLIAMAAFVVSWSVTRSAAEPLIIAGAVVDENDRPLGQAVISLATDSSKRATSEDNGNFKLDLSGEAKRADRIRVHVTKEGYKSYDGSVQVPTADFVVQLRRL